MMPATEVRSLEEVRDAVAEREQRQAELEEQARALEAEIEAARERVGEAVFRGAAADAQRELRQEVRDAEDELDGVRDALTLLDRELDQLADLEEEAELRETRERAETLTEEALQAIDGLAEMLAPFAREFAEEHEEVRQKLREAHRVERKVDKLEDRHRLRPQPTAYDEGYGKHPGLHHAVDALLAYARALVD